MQPFKYIFIPILWFISFLYGILIYIRNQLFDLGWIQINSFNKPIISIGNITLGGTGKTPLVIYIAKILLKKNITPGIISRGYKRKSKGMVVVHNGKKILVDVLISGDEPYLMAKTLEKVPIIVCNNRSVGIKKLLKNYSVDIIIMDDAFQHRKVKRDLDIVTIAANESNANYKLFPLGKMREPWQNIQRSDLVVYTKTENKIPDIHSKLQHHFPKDYTISTFDMLLMKYDINGYVETSAPNEPLFAFCGIADPQSFFKSILMLGINIQEKIIYKDHQNYNKTVINQLSQQIKENNGTKVITTEKDLVKLPDSFIDIFEIYIIKINLIFKEDSLIKNKINSLLIN